MLNKNFSSKLLVNIGLVVFSCFVSLVLFEFILVFSEKYIPKINNFQKVLVGWKNDDYLKLHEYDARRKLYKLKVVKNLRHKHDAGEYDYMINTDYCFGSVARPRCDQSDDFHFGDSFTFGFGIDERQIFTSLSAGLNFGVPGYSPVQEIEDAITIINSSKGRVPKRMWFHFFMGNDIYETIAYMESRESHTRELNRKSLKEKLVSKVLSARVFQLFQRIPDALRSKKMPDSYYYVPLHTKYFNQDILISYEYHYFYKSILSSLVKLKKNFNGEVIISLIPPKEICTTNLEQWRLMALDLKRLNDEKTKVIDYLNYRQCPKLFDDFFKIDTHFNDVGHRNYSEFLKNSLVD